jgi:hypothetical protein
VDIRALVLIFALGAALHAEVAEAQPLNDAEAARNELKEGFRLRREDRCEEALVHLGRSFVLDPQAKALLNMADCEERLRRYVDAEGHWLQARSLAEEGTPLRKEASERLLALEARMPRLTVAVREGAPAGLRVARDGSDLGRASLGVPLPCDPGSHSLEVSAAGYESRTIAVFLQDGDSKRVAVEPGPALPPAPAAEPLAPPPRIAAASEAAPQLPRPTGHKRDLIDFVGFGGTALGAAGIVLGTVEGLSAQRDHSDALHACGGDCARSPAAQGDQSNAKTAAAISTVGFAAGAAFLSSAGAVWLVSWLANRTPGSQGRVSVVPAAGSGVAVSVTW